MTTDRPTGKRELRREYLLAHHFPERYCRTFTIRTRRGTIHLCARCTGQVAGLVASLALAFLLDFGLRHVPGTLWSLGLLAVLPAPAAIDWTAQSLGLRESRNDIRSVTGGLMGAGIGLWLIGLAGGEWWWSLGGVLIFLGYSGTEFLVLTRGKALDRVIEEHFPGAGSTRPAVRPPIARPPEG